MPVSPQKKAEQEFVAALLEHLRSKYAAEPNRFREYLPEVAQLLDVSAPGKKQKRPNLRLTARERERRLESLASVASLMESGSADRTRAIGALEDFAALAFDELPPNSLDAEKRVALVKVVIGTGIGSVTKAERFPIIQGASPSFEISLVRGVRLEFTWDMKLIAISVNPQRYRERRRLFAVIGASRDQAADVAARHDDYLTEADHHGAA